MSKKKTTTKAPMKKTATAPKKAAKPTKVKKEATKPVKVAKPVISAPTPKGSRRPKSLTVDEWKDLASLPTLAAAIKQSGFYAPTINRYLQEHGIKTLWKPGRPKTVKSE